MNPFQQVSKAILSFLETRGKLALSITHGLDSAGKIFDHIAMLYKGKIIWVGKTGEIDSSGEPHVDQFIHGRAKGPIQMELCRL